MVIVIACFHANTTFRCLTHNTLTRFVAKPLNPRSLSTSKPGSAAASIRSTSLSLLRSLAPARCLLCGNHCGGPLCDGCSADLPPLGRRCPRCAEPLLQPAPLCARCQQNPRSIALDSTLAALLYEWPADVLIKRLKFDKNLAAGRALADQLAAAAEIHMLDASHRPDLLIPMPLHSSRRRWRGFNQSAELAQQIGQQLDLPVTLAAATRVRATTTQSLLPAAKRAGNLRGAFQVSDTVAGKNIAIIDDVMTTGASVIELAFAAKRAGALQVEGWVVTRAPAPGR